MLRRGENPADFEQLHQEPIEAGEPDDVMQEMSVKTIAEKSWDKEQLRAAWRESQLTALQVGQIQGQRRQLLARRWLPGTPAVEVEAQGLWQAKDRPSKFKRMFDRLDCLQKWFEDQVCPVEYPEAMRELYGECPSRAGGSIRLLFIDFFGSEGEVAAEKAAVLERQMREHTRALASVEDRAVAMARARPRHHKRPPAPTSGRQPRHGHRPDNPPSQPNAARRTACRLRTNRLSIGRPVSRLIRQRLHYAGGRRRRGGHGNGA